MDYFGTLHVHIRRTWWRSAGSGEPLPAGWLAGLMNASAPDGLGAAPVLVQDRPERLIQILTVSQERLPQDPLLCCADLPQGTVTASVGDGGARLKPVDAD